MSRSNANPDPNPHLYTHDPARNEYWRAVVETRCWIDTGRTESTNCFYGRSEIFRPVWERWVILEGEILELLHGGNFVYVLEKRTGVRFTDPANDPSPFEKRGYRSLNHVIVPLDHFVRTTPPCP